MSFQKTYKLISLFFVLFFFNGNELFAQVIIYGKVVDSLNNTIPRVNVTIEINDQIKNYTFSDDLGRYKLTIDKIGTGYELKYRSLGYKEYRVVLDDKSFHEKYIEKNVKLLSESIKLQEVLIKSDPVIEVKKDTVVFKVSAFTNGAEQVVEDLLKNIPGINLDSEGTIKIGNQEVEKVMVEGDDFFEKGYKVLTKNMPSQPLDKIEIIQNYSNNRLLKGIERNNKVALNLKLKDDYKSIWFGNIDVSYGIASKNRYSVKSNIMNFGKKNKFYFLTNFNNTGFNATGDIKQITRPLSINEPGSIGDNERLNSFLSLSSTKLNFKQSRTNFNNAELASLNAIFNPLQKFKIKVLGFLDIDETFFFENIIQEVEVDEVNFTNAENHELRSKKRIFFGKLDATYNITKTKMLEFITKYNNGHFTDSSNLIFNDISTIQNLRNQNKLFDQKITFSNKINDNKVFLISGRFIDEEMPEEYRINQFFYQDLFSEYTTVNNVKQIVNNKMRFSGFNLHLLTNGRNGNLFELQLGNEYREDRLSTQFSLLENKTVLDKPNFYQNQTNYQVNDLYIKSKYRFKINNFELIGNLGLHQFFNKLSYEQISYNQTPFFIKPSIGFEWKLNDKNKIISTYAYSTTNSKLLDVYNGFILTNYHTFSKGTGGFNELDVSSVVVNYQLGSWSNRFFANSSFLYSRNHDFFSTNSFIEQNYTQEKKIIIKDREFINLKSNLNYYFKFIESNFKVNLSYNQSEFRNIVNDSQYRAITSENFDYGFELRSGFKGFINYHIGTKWTNNKIISTSNNSFTNNVSFLDLSFIFNKNFNSEIQYERYDFGNEQRENIYYFLDFVSRYQIINNKVSIEIIGKNLLNVKKFRDFSLTDIGKSTVEYRLLPRFMTLNVKYRF